MSVVKEILALLDHSEKITFEQVAGDLHVTRTRKMDGVEEQRSLRVPLWALKGDPDSVISAGLASEDMNWYRSDW